MGLLTLGRTTPGATSDANGDLNNNWTLIETLVNGNLDASNLAADSVGSSEIAAGAVGSSEMAATINVTTSLSEASRRVLGRVTGGIGNGGTGANTTETDLQSQAITGGTLPATGGWMMKIVAAGTITGSANTKTVKLYAGATVIGTIALPAAATDDWEFEATIVGTGSSNVQKATCHFITSRGNVMAACQYTDLALDMSVSQTIKTTGTTPNSGDEVTSKLFHIHIANA